MITQHLYTTNMTRLWHACANATTFTTVWPRTRSEATGQADKLYHYMSRQLQYPDLLYVFIISLNCVYLAFRATVVTTTSDNLSFCPLAVDGRTGGSIRLCGAGK